MPENGMWGGEDHRKNPIRGPRLCSFSLFSFDYDKTKKMGGCRLVTKPLFRHQSRGGRGGKEESGGESRVVPEGSSVGGLLFFPPKNFLIF